MRNMVKITAAVLAFTMFASCGQLDDTSKAETKATSATATTTTVGTWKPSFENATTFTTTTSATTTTTKTTTTKTTTTKATTTKKATTTVQNNSNGGIMYYPSQDNNNYNYEDNQPSYNENNGDNDYSYEQPQQTEQTRQTTTTKKVEQPSNPSGNKITQSDIDAMKAELTAYSREKAEYIKEHYTEFWKYGTDFNTIEEYFELKEKSVTPENAGYDAVYVIPYTQGNLDETIQLYKRKIDYLYEKEGDVYYVVYIENCPNGHRVNSNPCWATYFLY